MLGALFASSIDCEEQEESSKGGNPQDCFFFEIGSDLVKGTFNWFRCLPDVQ